VKALAVELAFPVDESLVEAIDALLQVFEDRSKKG